MVLIYAVPEIGSRKYLYGFLGKLNIHKSLYIIKKPYILEDKCEGYAKVYKPCLDPLQVQPPGYSLPVVHKHLFGNYVTLIVQLRYQS